MESTEIVRAIRAYDALKMHELRLGRRSLPAFIGIGPARAGTSSLFGLLQQNPGIHLPPVKELNYFGFRSRSSQRVTGMTLAEYSTYFIGAARDAVCGEISPSYFILPGAIREMAAALPDCRIVSGLRHPLDRLISHFNFHRENHKYDDFDAFIAKARADFPNRRDPGIARHWFTPVRILASSLYADTLALCGQLFPQEHIFVYLFENYVQSVEPARAIERFLAVPPLAQQATRMNASEPGLTLLELTRTNYDWLREVFLEDLSRCHLPGTPAVSQYIHSLEHDPPERIGLRIRDKHG